MCWFFHKWYAKAEKDRNGYYWRFCTKKNCCAKQRLERCGASDQPVWRYKKDEKETAQAAKTQKM